MGQRNGYVCRQQTCTLAFHKVTSCSDKIHSLSLRMILKPRNRKQLFNTLKLRQKALTWQYPADLMFLTVVDHTPLSILQQHTLLQRHSCAVVYIGSPHPCQLTCALQAADEWVWSADFLPPSLPSSSWPTAYHDNPSIHHCALINFQCKLTSCFQSTLHASIFLFSTEVW